MLTSKALNKKTTVTYCTASNTLFVHKANIAPKNVYSTNSLRILRNVSNAQLSAFKQLPPTYLQKAKARAFPAFSSYVNAVTKMFKA